jgi:hypothetical protein
VGVVTTPQLHYMVVATNTKVAVCQDVGVVTTPQLHYMVVATNTKVAAVGQDVGHHPTATLHGRGYQHKGSSRSGWFAGKQWHFGTDPDLDPRIRAYLTN